MKPNENPLPPLPEYAENAFIERLPPIRSLKDVHNSFKRDPLHSTIDPRRPPEQRLHAVLRLLHYSQPTANSRDVGFQIDQMIRQSYIGRNPGTSDWARSVIACSDLERLVKEEATQGQRKAAVHSSDVLASLTPIRDTSMSGLVIGPPGMGKTHSVKTTLSSYDQVLFHGAPVQVAQIAWLRVECPPDGSLVSMCRFFFSAVDMALNRAGFKSELAVQYRTAPLAVLLTAMARVANQHAIGLLVIDEIQHVKVSRNEASALLNFLVTLRNTIGVSLLMVGTMSALPVMQRTFRDARRGDGIGSIPFNRMAPASGSNGCLADGQAENEPIYGLEFEDFVKRMWRWQYTNKHTDLSVEVLNALYHETQGIIDLVVKLFILCQMRLMTTTAVRPSNDETITPALVHAVADRSFNVVRRFIKALRENDLVTLAQCEDLIDFRSWFEAQLADYGKPELQPHHDADHGDPQLPPMVVEGSIDRQMLDQMLEGLGAAVEDRESIVSRHARLIEEGNIVGLVSAVKHELAVLQAQLKIKAPCLAKAPPIKGDLRPSLDGVTDVANVPQAVGAPDLDDALDK